jgi:hypothetical protein
MPFLVENERTKLSANALDRASTGCFASGIFVPVAAEMYGQITTPLDYLAVGVGAWLFIGVILHIEARRLLASLQE